jgi:hypothetical protein
MTRGRQANTAHVVTGKTAPAGHEPYQQAVPESVLADLCSATATTSHHGRLQRLQLPAQGHDTTGRSGCRGTHGHWLTRWPSGSREQ